MSVPSGLAANLSRDLSARGVRALLLRGPGPPGRPSSRPPDEPPVLELLVPQAHAARARAVLEASDWSYRLGSQGSWRVRPVATYSWARAPYLWREALLVELTWGVGIRRLERALWENASSRPAWFEPDAETLAVYLSLQAARGGPRREERLRHLSDCLSLASWERAEQIAARCRVRRALTSSSAALGGSREGGTGPGPAGAPYDRAIRRVAWEAGSFLAARVHPQRLRSLISSTFGSRAAATRCRFGGVEILVGPGVFVPELPSQRLVEVTLERIASQSAPLVVEPGTGSGAISIAIAAGHPGAIVHGVERYSTALRWARRNARRQGMTRVHLHRGSLLEPIPQSLAGRITAIVANLPYVPSRVWSGEGRFVQQAIRGQDDDGLGLYRRLARDARSLLQPGGHLILEMGPYQVDPFRSDVSSLGYSIESVQPEVLGAVVVTACLTNPGFDSGRDRFDQLPGER